MMTTHQYNPFLQSAVRKGQRLINESHQNVMLSQGIMTSCSDIVNFISTGNLEGALRSANNARGMAAQIAQNTENINQSISERMDMASHILSRIQYRVNELSSALESVRGGTGIGHQQYFGPIQPHYLSPTSFQQSSLM